MDSPRYLIYKLREWATSIEKVNIEFREGVTRLTPEQQEFILRGYTMAELVNDKHHKLLRDAADALERYTDHK